MSRRETQLKPVNLSILGGVNQRVRDTELPQHEFSTLEGVFPEFAGLQSRIFGKRLLKKYPDAIYGIHQFWTPQGYGGGLYQFEGTVDFGQWLTPISKFDLSLPSIGFNGGGMTFDEWGYPLGSNFGYGTEDACVISFLNGSTNHSACNLEPTPAGTPNDKNGGPAGQGRKCAWEIVTEGPLNINTFLSAKVQANGSYNNEIYRGPVKQPEPIPLGISAVTGTYVATITNNLFVQTVRNSFQVAGPFSTWVVNQNGTTFNRKGTLDLSAFEDDIVGVTFQVTDMGVSPLPPYYFSMEVMKDETGIAQPLEVSILDFINYNPAIPQGGGFDQQTVLEISSFDVIFRRRVCGNG